MHWGYGWEQAPGGIFMVLFWIVIIGLIAFLVKAVAGCSKKEEKTETALDILKKRYARSEISRDEFENIKPQLTKLKKQFFL